MELLQKQLGKVSIFGALDPSDFVSAAMEKEETERKARLEIQRIDEQRRKEAEEQREREEIDLKFALELQEEENKRLYSTNMVRGMGRGRKALEARNYQTPQRIRRSKKSYPDTDCRAILDREPFVEKQISRVYGRGQFHSNSAQKMFWQGDQPSVSRDVTEPLYLDTNFTIESDKSSPNKSQKSSCSSVSQSSETSPSSKSSTFSSSSLSSPQDTHGFPTLPDYPSLPTTPLPAFYESGPLPPVPVPVTPPESPPPTTTAQVQQAPRSAPYKRKSRIAARFPNKEVDPEEEVRTTVVKTEKEPSKPVCVSQLYGLPERALAPGRNKRIVGDMFDPAHRLLDNGLLRPEDHMLNPYSTGKPKGFLLEKDDFPPL